MELDNGAVSPADLTTGARPRIARVGRHESMELAQGDDVCILLLDYEIAHQKPRALTLARGFWYRRSWRGAPLGNRARLFTSAPSLPLRATRRAANKSVRQPFGDQSCSHIATSGLEHSAQPTVIAFLRTFRSRLAGAGDAREP